MNNIWFDYIAEAERRKDEVARVQEERRMARILRSRQVEGPSGLARYELFLAALGERLVAWGSRLQSRYRRAAESAAGTVSRSAGDSTELACCP